MSPHFSCQRFASALFTQQSLSFHSDCLSRYIPQLSGVLVAHDEHIFLRSNATIDADGAFATIPAAIKALVWAPQIGQRLGQSASFPFHYGKPAEDSPFNVPFDHTALPLPLPPNTASASTEGKLTLSTSSHVSLLMHGLFNASISSMHLPTSDSLSFSESNSTSFARPNRGAEVWTFVEGGFDAAYEQDEVLMEKQEKEGAVEDGEGEGEGQEEVDLEEGRRSTGYWKREKDGAKLGGAEGRIVFTVIG